MGRAASGHPGLLLVAILALGGIAAACGAARPPATQPAGAGPAAIVGAPSAAATARDPASPAPGGTPLASTRAAGPRLAPDPDAADYGVRDPWAPRRLAGRTHDIELAVGERFATVAEGYVQAVWTFEGTVPGPVIRVRAGDRVRVHLVNAPHPDSYPAQHPAVNLFPHAIVFQGSNGAGPGEVAPIGPGEATDLAFTAERPGVWLYHGGADPIIQGIAYGMVGMLIVEPEDGLDPVDQELFLVQGEWYLGGVFPPHPPLPSLDRAMAPDPEPDFVALNGVAGQYLDHPIEVQTGKRIRVFILDAGPNLDSSFQVEGVSFDRVIQDGDRMAGGGGPDGGDAIVRLAPGQGAIVELTLPRDGRYRFGTLGPGHAGLGAEGILQAAAGDP